MSYVQFFGDSYFLAWCSLWLFYIVVPLFKFGFLVINRILRTVKVVYRGWPPEHLDADGDWMPAQDDDEDNPENKDEL
jgi:hypothetical protein